MPTDSLCLINPKRSRLEPTIAPSALLVPLPGDLQQIHRHFSQKGGLTFKNNFLRVFQMADTPGAIGLGGPFMGAPQAVMALEKLIVLGARRVLFFGWTGALQPNLSPGDLVLPDEAISEEGTSRHYSDERRPRPSARLLDDLSMGLKEQGHLFKRGPVWTTDAPYRETINKVQAFQAQGVLGVDMETSAFFTAGAFRGIETAALLIVSDDLSGLTWRHGFREPRFLEARKKMARFLFHWVIGSSRG